MHIIKTAIVGFGMSGEYFHAPFINADPKFELVKVLERHTERSKRFYPYVNVVKNIEDILNDNEIELVIITTPNSTHYELGKKALMAGKNVIIEKPFTCTSKETEELITIAKKSNLVLSPFQNRRWDGDFLTVKKIVEEKRLGYLVEYRSHFDRFRNFIKPNTWKEEEEFGTGVLYDIGPHLIDQALVLFGLPKTIFADLRTQREGGKIIDNFELILNYGKLKVVLNSGFLYKQSYIRFGLFGTEGSFIKNGLDPQEDTLKLSGYSPGLNWGKENEELWGVLDTNSDGSNFKGKIETQAGCYQDYFENIYDAIINKKELAVKPEDALAYMRIIELAIESNDKKRVFDFNFS